MTEHEEPRISRSPERPRPEVFKDCGQPAAGRSSIGIAPCLHPGGDGIDNIMFNRGFRHRGVGLGMPVLNAPLPGLANRRLMFVERMAAIGCQA